MKTGLTGKRIRLVPPDKQTHLENALNWFNDPEVTKYLAITLPMYRAPEEEWFDKMGRDNSHIVWAIIDEHGNHIGFTGIHNIEWIHRRASTGIVIGEKNSWHKGYATEAMALRTAYAFEHLGLNRLESQAITENQWSRRALEQAGYRQEGIARQHYFREGTWHDVTRYAILAEDYFVARDKKNSEKNREAKHAD